MNILIVESETPDLVDAKELSLGLAYGRVLQEISSRMQFSIAEPYRHAFEPRDLDGIDGVVFPGASVAWSADDARGLALRRAMEQTFAAGLPCFGSCNGLQLAAVILGGRVETGVPEVGLARAVQLTTAGKKHPMMHGRQNLFCAPTVHGDQVVELPPGAVHLAQNDHCPIQAFSYESSGVNFWGVEYHPELSTADIAHYIDSNADHFASYQHLVEPLLAAESNAAAAAALGGSTAELNPATRRLELHNWLRLVSERAAQR